MAQHVTRSKRTLARLVMAIKSRSKFISLLHNSIFLKEEAERSSKTTLISRTKIISVQGRDSYIRRIASLIIKVSASMRASSSDLRILHECRAIVFVCARMLTWD